MITSPFHFCTFASRKIDEKVILIFHMMKISIKSNSIMNHARVSFFMVMLMLPLLGHARQVAYDYDADSQDSYKIYFPESKGQVFDSCCNIIRMCHVLKNRIET